MAEQTGMPDCTVSLWHNARCSGLIGKPEGCQRHPSEADAEFLQRAAARDGLGYAFSKFIEFVVHTVPFVCFVCSCFYHVLLRLHG
jgi:hypothetical protein